MVKMRKMAPVQDEATIFHPKFHFHQTTSNHHQSCQNRFCHCHCTIRHLHCLWTLAGVGDLGTPILTTSGTRSYFVREVKHSIAAKPILQRSINLTYRETRKTRNNIFKTLGNDRNELTSTPRVRFSISEIIQTDKFNSQFEFKFDF